VGTADRSIQHAVVCPKTTGWFTRDPAIAAPARRRSPRSTQVAS